MPIKLFLFEKPTKSSRARTLLTLPHLCIAVSFLFSATALGQTFSVLKHFGESAGDGENPTTELVYADGVLYGTTEYGGNGSGTVFRMNADGSNYQVLKRFDAIAANPTYYWTNSEGAYPEGGLVVTNGFIYGTTSDGGATGSGTIFKLSTNGGSFQLLKTFLDLPDGERPLGGLTLSGNTLFGTTTYGGSNDDGTVFTLNTDGSNFKIIRHFTDSIPNPKDHLVIAGTNLFGITSGEYGSACFFRLNTNGTGLISLHSIFEEAGAPAVSNTNLYCTHSIASTNGAAEGMIFSMDMNGNPLAVIRSFASLVFDPTIGKSTNSDGGYPQGGLVLSGSKLFGDTQEGGTFGYGTIFSVNTDGTGFTVLRHFGLASQSGSIQTNADGLLPMARLVVAGNAVYGTASQGGIHGQGTVFKIDLAPAPSLQYPVFSGSQFNFEWPAIIGGKYKIQIKTNLSQTDWVDFGPVITASNSLMKSQCPVSSDQGFFRMIYQP